MKNIRLLFAGIAVVAALSAAAKIDLPTREINGKMFYYYEVPSKATIYSITRTYGISREELIRYNPQVRDGLRAGDTLFFPVEETTEVAPTVVEEETAPIEETVQPTEEPVEESTAEEEKVTESEETPKEEISEETPGEEVATAEDVEKVTPIEEDVEQSENTVKVAVMLPFMLDQENMTRQAENNTNFYRGMLLAIDSLASRGGIKIELTAIDTEGSAATTARHLQQMDLSALDYVIAPNDSLSIEQIAAIADTTNASVVNLFAVKNDAHLRHESVVQANISHEAMYASAISAFCKEYKERKVVFLNATDISADKKTFTDMLQSELVKTGIPYETINFAGKLTADQTLELPERDYVFVPTSSGREMLMKIMPTLTEYVDAKPTSTISLFGYPEWVVIRGDLQERLHKLNTVVYSRFSTDNDNERVNAVCQAYKAAYGQTLPEAIPNSVLLGFDTMAWIISAAESGLTEPFEGVQNSFKVREIESAGNENGALYFITFSSTGDTRATVL